MIRTTACLGWTIGAAFISYKLFRPWNTSTSTTTTSTPMKTGSICATRANMLHPSWNSIVDFYIYIHNAFRNDMNRLIDYILLEATKQAKKNQKKMLKHNRRMSISKFGNDPNATNFRRSKLGGGVNRSYTNIEIPTENNENDDDNNNNNVKNDTNHVASEKNHQDEAAPTNPTSSSPSTTTTAKMLVDSHVVNEIKASLAIWKEAFIIHSKIEEELYLPSLLVRLKRAGLEANIPPELSNGKDHDELEALIWLVEKSVQDCQRYPTNNSSHSVKQHDSDTDDDDEHDDNDDDMMNSKKANGQSATTNGSINTSTTTTKKPEDNEENLVVIDSVLKSLRILKVSLERHLDREERELVPFFLHHFSERELWALNSLTTNEALGYYTEEQYKRIFVWWFGNLALSEWFPLVQNVLSQNRKQKHNNNELLLSEEEWETLRHDIPILEEYTLEELNHGSVQE